MKKIALLGVGHLNSALLAGLLAADFQAKNIIATCRSEESVRKVREKFKISCDTDNKALIKQGDIIILGVKPAQMLEVLQLLAQEDLSQKIIITLAAAPTLEHYRRILGSEVKLVRAMPNIAAAQQASLTGLFSDKALSEAEEQEIEALFSVLGGTEWLLDETQIDGIIALSASGIAVIYRVLQAMQKAGEHYGFEKDELYDILTQTAFGASVLALEEEKNPDFQEFINKIARKGGTTEAALKVIDGSAFDNILQEALDAAAKRSQSLSDEIARDW